MPQISICGSPETEPPEPLETRTLVVRRIFDEGQEIRPQSRTPQVPLQTELFQAVKDLVGAIPTATKRLAGIPILKSSPRHDQNRRAASLHLCLTASVHRYSIAGRMPDSVKGSQT